MGLFKKKKMDDYDRLLREIREYKAKIKPIMPSSSDPFFQTFTYRTSMYPTPTPKKKKPSPFKVGDRVRFKEGRQTAEDTARLGREYTVRCVHDDDDRLLYLFNYRENDHADDGRACGEHNTVWAAHFTDIEKVPVKKPIVIDVSHLSKVSLKPEIKRDIMAALTQASKHDLIYEKWGLGETIEYGKGMSMLFWGPPGTGKTWTAHCIAKAMGRELMTVTVGSIQSSMAGETNKNIEAAFKAAREGDKVLFLDEVDSFVGDRKYLGMILSSEINTLLTQIELFEGVVILATNMIGSLDPALERRLALIVEFKNPTLEERKEIWRMLLPKKFPLHGEVSIDSLAEHKLTGGFIKNVLLHAARLAAADNAEEVNMSHFVAAIERAKAGQGKMGTRGMQGVVDYQIKGSA